VAASKASSLSERLSTTWTAVSAWGEGVPSVPTTTGGHRPVVVLAADTIVTIDGRLLGKPRHLDDALNMLRTLSGRTHEVLSGVVARSVGGPIHTRVVSTRVTFRTLTDDEIRWYWDTGEPRDKAGSYAIQGIAGAFIASIEGSHSSVIGLPLVETVDLLRAAGLAPPWERTP
jgi:septum formation protein